MWQCEVVDHARSGSINIASECQNGPLQRKRRRRGSRNKWCESIELILVMSRTESAPFLGHKMLHASICLILVTFFFSLDSAGCWPSPWPQNHRESCLKPSYIRESIKVLAGYINHFSFILIEESALVLSMCQWPFPGSRFLLIPKRRAIVVVLDISRWRVHFAVMKRAWETYETFDEMAFEFWSTCRHDDSQAFFKVSWIQIREYKGVRQTVCTNDSSDIDVMVALAH